MHQIKRIDVGSVALYSFLVFLILGLVTFLPIGLIFSIVCNFIPDLCEVAPYTMPLFSGIFLLLFPILYALMGTIVNVMIVLLYNLISVKFGGIKISLEKIG